ncbi:helix-turn-helix transcriptional regulator [Paenibacillus sp. GCM10027628]|uniref:helix-turn-helix transcriptional regulator n=1 Tax=Paenibacillus sp. GCM10027628 TaxID=3273413 RepID=UPI00363015C8
MSRQLDRYAELSRFLRTRRERITPKEVGLPNSGRRRTPGLRREEVAILANVGIDWYTYLEQGRHINVSAEVLERIASVLKLDGPERRHLFLLASKQLPLGEPKITSQVSLSLQSFLDSQSFSPAVVMDARLNIIAWNEAYCALFEDIASLSVEERNIVWMTFNSERFRYMKGDEWEVHARRIAAKFHADYARHADDPWWSEQFDALCQSSPEFRGYWDSQEILDATDAPKTLRCPNIGILNFDHVTFQYSENTNLSVCIHFPRRDGTLEKMQQLLNDNQHQHSVKLNP